MQNLNCSLDKID